MTNPLTPVVTAIEQDLTCFRGDTAEWSVSVTKDGVSITLTGAKLWMTALRGRGGAQVFQKTELSGITPDADQSANRGKALIKLAPADTSSLASETVTLYYDIQVLTAGGELFTVAYGNLIVSPDATLAIS